MSRIYEFFNIFFFSHFIKGTFPHSVLLMYLVDETNSWSLAAIQKVNVDDLELLQSDVESFKLTVVPVQWDHLKQAVIQPQANHTAFWVYNSDDTRL